MEEELADVKHQADEYAVIDKVLGEEGLQWLLALTIRPAQFCKRVKEYSSALSTINESNKKILKESSLLATQVIDLIKKYTESGLEEKRLKRYNDLDKKAPWRAIGRYLKFNHKLLGRKKIIQNRMGIMATLLRSCYNSVELPDDSALSQQLDTIFLKPNKNRAATSHRYLLGTIFDQNPKPTELPGKNKPGIYLYRFKSDEPKQLGDKKAPQQPKIKKDYDIHALVIHKNNHEQFALTEMFAQANDEDTLDTIGELARKCLENLVASKNVKWPEENNKKSLRVPSREYRALECFIKNWCLNTMRFKLGLRQLKGRKKENSVQFRKNLKIIHDDNKQGIVEGISFFNSKLAMSLRNKLPSKIEYERLKNENVELEENAVKYTDNLRTAQQKNRILLDKKARLEEDLERLEFKQRGKKIV